MSRRRIESRASAGRVSQAASSANDPDFRALFVRSPDPSLVIDRQRRIVLANWAACELTGYSLEKLCGRLFQDIFSDDVPNDDDRPERQELVTRRDGGKVLVDLRTSDLSGGYRQIVLRDLADNPPGYFELTQTVEGFNNLVQVCDAAVVTAGAAGAAGIIQSWNPAAESLFGYSAKEAIGMPILRLVPERLQERHMLSFARCLESRPPLPYGRTLQTEARTQDGREIPVELTVAAGQRDDQPVFPAVIRDLSEYRRVVDELNDALQRLRFHVARMPLAYIVWDTSFRVVEWNPAAERIFGFSAEEALGQRAYDLLVPDDAVAAVDAVWSDLLRGEMSSHSVNANLRKDGSRITCEWFNTPLRDAQGHVRGVASMAQDITDRAVLEARIRDAQRVERLGVLASGIAHDFNSSLMVILGNAALLESVDDLPETTRDHPEMIEQAGARAKKLIDHMLTYARTGRHNPQPTDLKTVIQNSLGFLRSMLGDRCPLELDLDDDLPMIVADIAQVEQIVLNLCHNARCAMGGAGTVKIATRTRRLSAREIQRSALYDATPGKYVELVVSVRGCGMSQEIVSRIFDPFFSTRTDGHGLGLTAVLGILRQHAGTILVDAKPGRGTSMHVCFPVPSRRSSAES